MRALEALHDFWARGTRWRLHTPQLLGPPPRFSTSLRSGPPPLPPLRAVALAARMRAPLETAAVWRSPCPLLEAEAEEHLPMAQWVGAGGGTGLWPNFWVEPPLAWSLRVAAEA
ncbi:unnamed protein product [Prorocentrum cordatum]|uniref:Uncharacterized protein n=1 Tax=Prorocentrum cordatum TaxID=2364126 RepID=A0ABN9T4M0_9DINO|nr:unnamed protein product [Polarella glacialis]